MKIAFILPGSNLSGGTKTVFDLAIRLNKLPFLSSFVIVDNYPSWLKKAPPLIITSSSKIDLSPFDVIISTFYNQDSFYKIWGHKKIFIHLCQGYEGDYLEDLNLKHWRPRIENFYKLPYPKMVISRFLIAKLQKITKAPIYYIGQAVDHSLFKPQQNLFRDRDTILIVGQFELPFKGIKNALILAQKIKKKYPPLKIVRVSPTDTQEQEACFEIDEFWVAVPPNEMPRFYQKAILSIYFPTKEGFGLPVLESLACGTPVVGSDIPPLREICGPKYPLFSSLDESLKFAVLLLENSIYYQNIVQLGLNRARLFTFKKLIVRFLYNLCKSWWYYKKKS